MSTPSSTAYLPQGFAALPHGHTKALALSALGVVFGDIGTSPLYTLKVVLGATGSQAADRAMVLGSLSLHILDALILTTIKYVGVAMRVDNHGEGGIMALMALLTDRKVWEAGGQGRQRSSSTVGLIGAALIYGDGVITPAISVLSALEGLSVGPARLEALCGARNRSHSRSSFFRPATGHGAYRQYVRSDHGYLVSCPGCFCLLGIAHNPVVIAAIKPAPWPQVSCIRGSDVLPAFLARFFLRHRRGKLFTRTWATLDAAPFAWHGSASYSPASS